MRNFNQVITQRTIATDFLRLVLCAIIFTHGAYRFYEGSTPVLGQILTKVGFPFGTVLAYAVNLTETLGAALLAVRLLVLPVCFALMIIYVTGVVLFHWRQGFFVVGPGSGGWEFSALLISCLLVTAWEHKKSVPIGAA